MTDSDQERTAGEALAAMTICMGLITYFVKSGMIQRSAMRDVLDRMQLETARSFPNHPGMERGMKIIDGILSRMPPPPDDVAQKELT